MSGQPHLTNAQFRMLGRAVRGEALSCDSYRVEGSTVAALKAKGLIVAASAVGIGRVWVVRERGREVYARHGKNPAVDDG